MSLEERVRTALAWKDQTLWRGCWKTDKQTIVFGLVDTDKRSVFHWCVENGCLSFLEDCIDHAKSVQSHNAKPSRPGTLKSPPPAMTQPSTDSKDSKEPKVEPESTKLATVEQLVNNPDDGGWSPFLLACAYGNVQVMNVLIRAGAKIDQVVDTTGNTGLHIAAGKGDLEMCKALMSAFSLQGIERSIIEKRNNQGYTPLLKAVSADRDEVAKFLISRRADCEAADPTSRQNILHIAVLNGNVAFVEWLLENHPKLDLEKDKDGRRPSSYATDAVAQTFRSMLH
eukprot:Protomagalhaensia_sp_Gyna_25__5731@NODE_824_length_2548_cov_1101_235153_g649_i0_p1_GENE_NODE_824_length_2548_cov_1101_235153_g649_i0NODE_824_length_2548_cov_1101_235153_g649_i0_p1_ORF_typecomplete_len284_score31_52Ank_2/PF12796_7/8e07Ank_2/PF12796_7/2e12Ank_2/PF12796_7/2_9e12Ank_2/PF12796_7/0_00011Ank_4/PF13637_6/7_4e05Ank_4/PF13637_6/2_3e11Ank_4/PF13637_6/0_018Ank_4/PF13637_6/3_5e10Ank_5/PF13857_6/4_7e02Ank_5/PF13857_6/3e05Ank_5/PF13857_6/0_0008Ank_5/PF13857_6/1_3e06Ank_5/PF13857_6/6e05Ank_3/PF